MRPLKLLNLRQPLKRNHPLNRGLVSEWVVIPGLAGGSKLYDIAGLSHGTLVNGPTWLSRSGGFGSLSFDGTNDYINISSVCSKVNTTEGTLTFWIADPSVINANFRAVINIRNDGSNEIDVFRFDNTSGIRFSYSAGGVAKQIFATPSVLVQNNTWYHCTFIWSLSRNEVKLFINGKQTGSTLTSLGTFSGTPSTAYIANDQFNEYYAGRLDAVTLYKRAFSDSEVLLFYYESKANNPSRYNWLDISQLTQPQIEVLSTVYRYNLFRSPVIGGISREEDD
jgi:hypothetical protein